MKYPLAIFTAAAAAALALVRSVMGETAPEIDPDAASLIPPLTPKLVESLAYAGGTDAEIADRFLVAESFITRHFARELTVARALRKLTLRGFQTDATRKLNASMLVWLGKNELGQSASPMPDDDPLPETTDGGSDDN